MTKIRVTTKVLSATDRLGQRIVVTVGGLRMVFGRDYSETLEAQRNRLAHEVAAGEWPGTLTFSQSWVAPRGVRVHEFVGE